LAFTGNKAKNSAAPTAAYLPNRTKPLAAIPNPPAFK
jgi:hypothetical protein